VSDSERFVLLPPDSEALSANSPLTEATAEATSTPSTTPTTPLPVKSATDDTYETMKRAFKDAVFELKDVLASIIADGIRAAEAINVAEEEPYIGYRERYQRIKFVLLGLVPSILVGVIISASLVLLSGHILATTTALVFIWAVGVVTRLLIERRQAKSDAKNIKVLTTTLRLIWYVGVIVLSGILGILLVSRGVEASFLIGYTVLAIILLYVIAREHYKWSALWIYREDIFLIAARPLSKRFFLKEFYEQLMLQELVDNKKTPTFVEGVFKIGRVFLNVPGDEDNYWNTLSFIKNPNQLIAAANQGSKKSRSN